MKLSSSNRFSIVLILFVMLVIFPFILAFLKGGEDYVFGGFLVNPIDGNSYLAKMYEGWRGEWKFTLPYTAQPGNGAYLFLFYLFLGHLARWINLPLISVFHLARIFCAVLLLGSLYRFYSVIFPTNHWLLPIFVLTVFGSGLGWVASIFGGFTSDLWVAEAFPFLSSFVNPHFPLGMATLLIILSWPGRPKVQRKFHLFSELVRQWPVIILSLLLSIVTPFGIVIALTIIGGLFIWHLVECWINRMRFHPAGWKMAANAMIDNHINSAELLSLGIHFIYIFLGGGIYLIYQFLIIRGDGVLSGWNVQNLTLTPPFWDVMLSLSPALILAIPGIWQAIRRRNEMDRLLTVWILASMVLIYFPFTLQRRFLMGIYVPVAGLAGVGLEWLAATGMKKFAGMCFGTAFLLSIPTNILIVLAAVFGIRTHDPQIYLRGGEVRAMEWIAINSKPDAIIVASPEMGLYIPAYTGRRVLYGHPFETVQAEEKEAILIQLLEGCQTVAGKYAPEQFLRENRVNFVLWGWREKKFALIPPVNFLKPVFQDSGVEVYSTGF